MHTTAPLQAIPLYIRKSFWALTVLAALMAFPFLGSRGLYESTEGRYAEVAREMLEKRNFVEPTLNYEPHWTKPPLTYHAIAAGIALFGVNAWGGRFFLGIAFVYTVLAIYGLGKTIWDRATGYIAGLIYLSSVLPIAGGNSICTDMVLTLWITVAILCYFKADRCPRPYARNAWIVLMWGCWGFAFLTKGPPSLLVFGTLVLWHYLRKKPRPLLLQPAGIILFLLIGLGWYVLVCLRNEGLFSYFIGREVLGRVLSEEDRNPEWYKPFIIYLPVLTLGAGLWFPAFCRMFAAYDLFDPSAIIRRIRRAGVSAFLLLWLLLPLIIFSISQSRLVFYVLPLYGAVALAIGRWITMQQDLRSWLRKGTLYAVITIVIATAVKATLPLVASKKDMSKVYNLAVDSGALDAEIYLVEEQRYYGLQFYLNGKLKRANLEDRRSWADTKLKHTFGALRENPLEPPHAYLVRDKYEGKFRARLKETGLQYCMSESRDWAVFLVQPLGDQTLSNDSTPLRLPKNP